MSILVPPHGFEGLLKLGDPRAFLGDDGVMSAAELARWEQQLGLVYVPFPLPLALAWGRPGDVARGLRCHPIAVESFRHAFHVLHAEGLWPELKTFGGGFIARMQRGSADRWSAHSWGLAADWDVLNNPLGAEPRLHPGVLQIFEACGFVCGARWAHRPDGGHVQWVTGW